MMELEKLRQRVDEFNDYGELDMMQQYVQDVRMLQKRLAETRDQIEWINRVCDRSLIGDGGFILKLMHNILKIST